MESRENSTFIVSASGKKRRVRAREFHPFYALSFLFPVLVLILVFVLLFFSRFADAAKRFRKGSPPRLRFVVPLAFPRIQPRVCLCRACLPLTQPRRARMCNCVRALISRYVWDERAPVSITWSRRPLSGILPSLSCLFFFLPFSSLSFSCVDPAAPLSSLSLFVFFLFLSSRLSVYTHARVYFPKGEMETSKKRMDNNGKAKRYDVGGRSEDATDA